MKLIVLLMAAALVTGCATKSAATHSQIYRPAGSETAMNIQGAISSKPGLLENELSVFVRVDNVTRIGLKLSPGGNGEISCPAGSDIVGCKSLPDRDLSITCNGSTRNNRVSAVTCFVFVNNEKATTFTFN